MAFVGAALLFPRAAPPRLLPPHLASAMLTTAVVVFIGVAPKGALAGGIVADGDRCDFERVDGRMVDQHFLGGLASLRRPVILTNLIEDWPARSRWSSAAAFAKLHGAAMGYARDHDQLELRDLDVTVADYLAGHSSGEKPLNLTPASSFFVNDLEDSRLLDQLDNDWKVPEPLQHVGTLRVVSLERPGAGVALHRHEVAWQALLAGRKRWYLVDSAVEAVPLKYPCSFSDEEDGAPPSAQQCTVEAGEVIYVPDKWWHATCSLPSEPSLAIGGIGPLQGWPPALLAARRGDLAGVLDGLRQAGAGDNVDALEVPAGVGVFAGGERALYLAAAYGRVDLAKELLARGANVDLRQREGRTALHEAARRGDLALVSLLVEAGAAIAAVDDKGSTALHDACADRGAPDVVEYLLTNGARAGIPRLDGRTPLHVACRARRNPLATLRLLMQKGHAPPSSRDKEGATPLMHCAAAGHAQGVGLLLKMGGTAAVHLVDSQGDDALSHALAGRGDAGVVDRLLKAGLKPGPRAAATAAGQGFTGLLPSLGAAGADLAGAISSAAWNGHVRTVEALLKNNSSAVDEVEEDGGAMPLHVSSLSGHLGVVKALLAARADAAAKDNDGLTPLHYAATSAVAPSSGGSDSTGKAAAAEAAARARAPRPWRRRAVAEELLDAGADPSAAATGGTTPLHLAAVAGDVELVKLLVERLDIASLGALDDANNTAAALAAQAKHTDLAMFIQSRQKAVEADTFGGPSDVISGVIESAEL